jgi:hypothetical protein
VGADGDVRPCGGLLDLRSKGEPWPAHAPDEAGRRNLVDDAVVQAFRVVDHLVWRLAQLFGGLLVLAAFLGWLVLRTGRVTLAASGGRGVNDAQP